MSEPDILIIGAGPAGLAAGAELGRLGVPAAILERADLSPRRGAGGMTGCG